MSAATNSIGISRIGQISINVHDLDRSVTFYRDVLGLPLLFTAGGMAFFDCGGVRLMLAHPEKPGVSTILVPYSISPCLISRVRIGNSMTKACDLQGAPHVIARMPTYDLWMGFFLRFRR